MMMGRGGKKTGKTKRMKTFQAGTALKFSKKIQGTYKILENIWNQGFSAAYYRLPHETSRYMVIDLSPASQVTDPEIEEMEPGFILAPFEHSPGTKKWFIKGDIILKEANGTPELFYLSSKPGTQDSEQLIYGENRLMPTAKKAAHYVKKPNIETTTSRREYLRMVREAIQSIDQGRFQKVVPARQIKIALPETFEPLRLFDKLCAEYPNTFVYLVTTPEAGTWIGASPEILLKIDKDSIFRTTALAGTQPYIDHVQLTEVAWTQKDIEEQAMVSRYIINCFKQIRLREFDEIGPKTIKAGNLIHLKTNYIVDMKKVNFPRLGSVLLKLLHPTSAVCGLPEAPAMRFIKDLEPFDRSFFSGYLGPVNISNETHIYVNIRCMNLLDQNALLFAGAGVTIDSKPEKEWLETEIKLQTLLDLI